MKLLTWGVFVIGVVLMGFGIYLITYSDDTKKIAEMDEGERPPCYAVFPAYIRFLGSLEIAVSFLGVLAYFGNTIHDEGTFLVLQTIHSLWLIVVALHVSNLGNFEDKEILALKKEVVMKALIDARETTVNATADPVEKMKAFKQLAEVKQIETLNYCCGTSGPKDYITAGYKIPKSCCMVKNCDVNVTTNLYSAGCYEYFKTYVFNNNEGNEEKQGFPIKVMSRNLAIQIILTLIYYAVIFFSRIWPDTKETPVI